MSPSIRTRIRRLAWYDGLLLVVTVNWSIVGLDPGCSRDEVLEAAER